MARHFQNELSKIKKKILSLGALVEERVRRAVQALETRDAAKAKTIVDTDYEIDEREVEIEEECLKIMALHQPVAVDLRFLVAVIKINSDLERIADEAVNIAQAVEHITSRPAQPFAFDYAAMAEQVEAMLTWSLDALVNMDTDMAFKVLMLDDEVDGRNQDAHERVKAAIREDNAQHVGYFISLMLVSRHLERIADHATNIAEEVIYLIDGEIVRHGNF
jgi:phosphate transport system protein